MTQAEAVIEEVRTRVTSDKSDDFTLIIEPWGDTHCVKPTDEHVILARGPAPARPELVQGDNTRTYYGWIGAAPTLYLNGESPD